jgi:hypothetical protein
MRRAAAVASIVGALATGSCQQLGDIRISGTLDAPVLEAVAGGILKRPLTCITEAWVAAEGATVWRIRVAGEDCVEVRRLQYGVVPTGFVVASAKRPLSANVTYSFGANGWKRPGVPFQAETSSSFRNGRWTRLGREN